MAVTRQQPIGAQPVYFRPERVEVHWWQTLGAWTGRRISRGTQILIHSPVSLVVFVLVVAGGLTSLVAGPLLPFSAAAAVTFGLLAWGLTRRDSFRRHVLHRMRATWRSWHVYRIHWRKRLVGAGMMVGRAFTPLHVHTTWNGYGDQVLVRMCDGQTVDDYADQAESLLSAFRAENCEPRSVPGRSNWVELRFLLKDPLRKIIAPHEPEADPLPLEGVPVAKTEAGEWWRLKIIGHHTLIVGATEAGKSNVIWRIVQALEKAIDAGLAQLWVIDPRGGMELGMGAVLFHRFVFEHDEIYADLLEEAVRVMKRRQKAALGVRKQHIPTIAEPQIVMIIDEIGSLTAYSSNRPARKRIEAALALLLSQGRLSGVSVIGAIQDPRKENVHLRDLFPTRICLRVTEAEHVSMCLGPGARARGARCDKLDEKYPGIAYVGVDGRADYQRIRFSHDDEWIAGLRRRRYERDNPYGRQHRPPERHLHLVRNPDDEMPRLTNL